jgi:tetratricopeptide (TPR) repeat protein
MFNQVTVNHMRSAWLNACFLLSAFVISLLPGASFAQDKIYKTNKTVIEAKVTEINASEIKYKKFSNLNGPAYIVPRKEVSMIVYENGEKEIYNQGQTTQDPNAKMGANGKGSLGANSSIDQARNFILNENINGGIATYAKLISSDLNDPLLLSEDAYALALGGIYDAALMRLDLCRNMGAITPEINYFTSQVFALMGYNDLANEYWKASDINKAPTWIFSKSGLLLQKYKSKSPVSKTKSREALIANFKHANELASQNLYFQSIALFHDIVTTYPNEYLPYVGYSITLEKTGAFEKSAESIEKAISLIGNTADDNAKKQLLEKRLATIRQNMTLLPSPYSTPVKTKLEQSDHPQMMAYAGGMVAPSMINVNGRIGYFVSGASNASLDFSVMKMDSTSYSNVGLSVYSQKNGFVSGAGIMMNSGSGNTNFSFKLSVGYSKMNKSRTSSIDIFVDVNKGLKKDAMTTAIMSIGTSFYFGKR